jgi:hypothetical protein
LKFTYKLKEDIVVHEMKGNSSQKVVVGKKGECFTTDHKGVLEINGYRFTQSDIQKNWCDVMIRQK